MELHNRKRAAARAALTELPGEGVIGLGSGSTVSFFLEELAALVREGRRYVGVPSSAATRARASELGIELLDDVGPWDILVNVDGADEIDRDCNAIKGAGAAHAREKIVNYAARRNVLIADDSKVSEQLGTRARVPIEVLPFGHGATARALRPFGESTLRAGTTDNGNLIYDVAVGPTSDPGGLERALRAVVGVVEVGLFVGRFDVAFVASETGVVRLCVQNGSLRAS
jgi:ribose 5-phosphate isomerase A